MSWEVGLKIEGRFAGLAMFATEGVGSAERQLCENEMSVCGCRTRNHLLEMN
jgi:hypothetical protein